MEVPQQAESINFQSGTFQAHIFKSTLLNVPKIQDLHIPTDVLQRTSVGIYF